MRKIRSREEWVAVASHLKSLGTYIGFTSGAFDLFHVGHVNFLKQAALAADMLIVGINSDESVRQSKGPNRPYFTQDERAEIVASINGVAGVFIFDEVDNSVNLDQLRPSVYLKGSEYSQPGKTLGSAELVGSYGGKIKLIESLPVHTSDIVHRVLHSQVLPPVDVGEGKALLVDRDGTINKDTGYLCVPEQVELLPGAGEGLRLFQDMGYQIVIVTMQSGIGLGYYSKVDFFNINRVLFQKLSRFGVSVRRVYFETRYPTNGENPKALLVERAKKDLNLNLSKCVALGDKEADLDVFPENQGVRIGVRAGHTIWSDRSSSAIDYVADDILSAATWVSERSGCG